MEGKDSWSSVCRTNEKANPEKQEQRMYVSREKSGEEVLVTAPSVMGPFPRP